MGVANISGNILTDSGASLSSYLPLTGGTLTGGLSGTTANFSGDVTLSKITTATGLEYQVRNTNGASGNHVFKSFNTAILTLDGGTNAATFSSDVILPYSKALAFNSISNQYITADASFLYLGAGNTWRLKLDASTGAATFSSTSGIGATIIADWNRSLTNDSQLYIKGATNGNKQLRIGYDTTGNVGYIQALTSGTSVDNLLLNPSGGNVGIGTTPNKKFEVAIGSDAMRLSRAAAGEFDMSLDTTGNIIYDTTIGAGQIFRTNGGSERMRITSGGFTKISNSGTYATTNNVHEIRSSTSNDYALLVGNTSAAPYGVYINYPNASPNSSSTNEFFICGDSNNTKLIVWSNGTVVNRTGSYGTISDVTLKENIVDATPKLDDLIKLKVRNFNFIGEDLKQLGFVAQEMEEVFPNMVDTDKEGLKSIKTSILIPMLVKAIQELNAKVTALENK